MTLDAPFCATCGRPSTDPACCQRAATAVIFDRDGDAIWDPTRPGFCPRCGARVEAAGRGRRELHACVPLEIRFYGVSSDFGAFSNFAASPILVEGKRYPTTEHYFQAQKFAGTDYAETIRRAKTPLRAARLGRSRRERLRSDWESVKRAVMERALLAKFTQHADLRALLLSTGEARLVEHTATDAYWGDGGDGRGQNWLGRLLVRLRERLQARGNEPPPPST